MEFNLISVASSSSINTDNMSQKLFNNGNFQILEEGPQTSQHLNMKNLAIDQEGPQVSQDFNMRNLSILEEGPKICPLCSQEVRMYFINFDEKIEMCENVECDYPFGFEPLKVIREENGVQTVEMKSVTVGGTRSTACSQVSSQAWSDVDKLCKVFDTEDTSSMELYKNHVKTTPRLEKSDSQRRKEELMQNVEKVKQLTRNMSVMKKESKGIIKNEKWIKNLQYLQGLSGCNLLKPAELMKINDARTPSSGELRIDIDKSNLANVKIEMNWPVPSSSTQV